MSEFQTGRRFLFRFGTSLITLTLLLIFMSLCLMDRPLYVSLVKAMTGIQKPQPLSDFNAVIQASLCWRQGVNVYLANSCMNGGVYNYSPFLLRAAYLPMNLKDLSSGGIVLDLVFVAFLSVLPPPASGREFLTRMIAAISTSTLFALETANIDIVMFIATILGVILLSRNTMSRIFGYFIFVFFTALKFYPVTLLIFILRENLKLLLILTALTALSGFTFVYLFFGGIKTAYEILPSGLPFTWLFGAINLPFGLMLLWFLPILTLAPNAAQYAVGTTHPLASYIVILGKFFLAAISVLIAIKMQYNYKVIFNKLSIEKQLFLIAGCVIIIGCFFIAQNIDYRAIFLILTIPGLYSLIIASSGQSKRLPSILVLGISIVMWESFLRQLVLYFSTILLSSSVAVYPQIIFWLFREFIWWFIITQFLSIFFCFLNLNLIRLRGQTEALLS